MSLEACSIRARTYNGLIHTYFPYSIIFVGFIVYNLRIRNWMHVLGANLFYYSVVWVSTLLLPFLIRAPLSQYGLVRPLLVLKQILERLYISITCVCERELLLTSTHQVLFSLIMHERSESAVRVECTNRPDPKDHSWTRRLHHQHIHQLTQSVCLLIVKFSKEWVAIIYCYYIVYY